MIFQSAQLAEAVLSQSSVFVDREFLVGVAQLLECLRQAQSPIFARAGDVVKINDLGQDRLAGAGFLEHASIWIYDRGPTTAPGLVAIDANEIALVENALPL